MTRDEAKRLLPVIQAYADGKEIQARMGVHDTWDTQESVSFTCGDCEYRIKPELREYWVDPDRTPMVTSGCTKYAIRGVPYIKVREVLE